MSNIHSASRLNFFKAEKYEHGDHIFDASCAPRPHFCMGLLIEGKADFAESCGNRESFSLSPGELVFVPITSRYVSHWHAAPYVRYISLHFAFDYPGIFTRNKNFKLQKIIPSDAQKTLSDFEFILNNYNGSETEQLYALAKFFEVLGTILPNLESGKAPQLDERIAQTIKYMESNYAENITAQELSAIANMSLSRFYPCFKKAVGVTPVEYLNRYRTSKAVALLTNNDDMTIESISGEVGFESSTYFRRVFKKITGKSPKDYRKISAEI